MPPATALKVAPPAGVAATADQKSFLEGLKFVTAALPGRPPMQVLLGVRIEASEKGITLAAFDYELSARETVTGSGSGTSLVPGKFLMDCVKTLDSGAFTLSVEKDKVILTQGDLRFTLPTLPVEDYPALPKTTGKRLATVSGEQLASLNRASVAVGRDNTLPVLTGIRLASEEGQLVTAATDRYRLAVVTTDIPATDQDAALVPHQTFAFLAKHFAASKSVALRLASEKGDSARTLVAQDGTRIITSRLLEGEFPKYKSLLPHSDAFTAEVLVDTPDFIKAIKQVNVAASRNAPVRLGCSEAGILLETGNVEDSSASKLVKTPLQGTPLAIAYNPAYLLEGINAATNKKQARLKFTAPTRPGIIDHPEDPTFTYLLMPVRMSA